MKRKDLWKFAAMIFTAVIAVFGIAIYTEAGMLTLPSSVDPHSLGDADEIQQIHEEMRDSINEVESEQVKDGTLTDDDVSSNSADRIAITKIGDPGGSLNDGLYDYIRGATCSITTGDYWKIGAGEIAIVDTNGDVQWCRNTSATTAVSVDAQLGNPGDGSQGKTYYGFAVDNGSGGYTALTKIAPGETAGERLVCSMLMASTGDPPAIDAITDTVYYYHASPDATYTKQDKVYDDEGTGTSVTGIKYITGWDWVRFNGGSDPQETTAVTYSGLSTIYNVQVTYVGYSAAEPSTWTGLSTQNVIQANHKPKIAYGTYDVSKTGFTFYLGASYNKIADEGSANILGDGYYVFIWLVAGE